MNDMYSDRQNNQNLLPTVMVLTITVLILTAYLLYQMVTEHSALLVTLGAQEQPLHQSQQVKEQFDALAMATAKLAEQGNRDAKAIIDGMKSQGINIRQ